MMMPAERRIASRLHVVRATKKAARRASFALSAGVRNCPIKQRNNRALGISTVRTHPLKSVRSPPKVGGLVGGLWHGTNYCFCEARSAGAPRRRARALPAGEGQLRQELAVEV